MAEATFTEEKRLDARSLCADLVTFEWKDRRGRLHELGGVLEDISSSGACIQVEFPVPVDVRALIRHGKKWAAPCRTSYCIYREIGYFIGVEFEAGVFWSECDFKPQHLLNLAQLAAGAD